MPAGLARRRRRCGDQRPSRCRGVTHHVNSVGRSAAAAAPQDAALIHFHSRQRPQPCVATGASASRSRGRRSCPLAAWDGGGSAWGWGSATGWPRRCCLFLADGATSDAVDLRLPGPARLCSVHDATRGAIVPARARHVFDRVDRKVQLRRHPRSHCDARLPLHHADCAPRRHEGPHDALLRRGPCASLPVLQRPGVQQRARCRPAPRCGSKQAAVAAVATGAQPWWLSRVSHLCADLGPLSHRSAAPRTPPRRAWNMAAAEVAAARRPEALAAAAAVRAGLPGVEATAAAPPPAATGGLPTWRSWTGARSSLAAGWLTVSEALSGRW